MERHARRTLIRESAWQMGVYNAALIGGIAISETNLASAETRDLRSGDLEGVRPIRDDRTVTRESLVIAAWVLAGALIALVLARLVRQWRGSLRARVRARRAGAGEDRAAAMLRHAGYRIVARQARTWWAPVVDGVPHETELRADYLVEAATGELFVAEVKTGDEAPRIATAATRRQLLEYHVAFHVALGAEGVLLVCPELGTIHRVEFPSLDRTKSCPSDRTVRGSKRDGLPALPDVPLRL